MYYEKRLYIVSASLSQSLTDAILSLVYSWCGSIIHTKSFRGYWHYIFRKVFLVNSRLTRGFNCINSENIGQQCCNW